MPNSSEQRGIAYWIGLTLTILLKWSWCHVGLSLVTSLRWTCALVDIKELLIWKQQIAFANLYPENPLLPALMAPWMTTPCRLRCEHSKRWSARSVPPCPQPAMPRWRQGCRCRTSRLLSARGLRPQIRPAVKPTAAVSPLDTPPSSERTGVKAGEPSDRAGHETEEAALSGLTPYRSGRTPPRSALRGSTSRPASPSLPGWGPHRGPPLTWRGPAPSRRLTSLTSPCQSLSLRWELMAPAGVRRRAAPPAPARPSAERPAGRGGAWPGRGAGPGPPPRSEGAVRQPRVEGAARGPLVSPVEARQPERAGDAVLSARPGTSGALPTLIWAANAAAA